VDIILLVLHVVLSLGIITLVLLQKGAGASAGAAFGGGGGGGGAGSVFGATGSANFLSKTTAIFAVGFFVNSLALAYLASNREIQNDSVIDALIEQPATELVVPADPAAAQGDEQSLDVPLADIPAASEEDTASDVQSADVPPPASE
jgi:preprotein translocase subunit SecG